MIRNTHKIHAQSCQNTNELLRKQSKNNVHMKASLHEQLKRLSFAVFARLKLLDHQGVGPDDCLGLVPEAFVVSRMR